MNKTLEARSGEIRSWGESLSSGVDLRLVKTDDKRTPLFTAFAEDLCGLVPGIRLTEERGENGAPPAIQLEDSWTLHLLPEGKELDPFLELLRNISTGGPQIPTQLMEQLKPIEIPVVVDVFIATHCPNCPAVMAHIALFPFANRLVQVRAIDGMLFPEMAQERGIRAVPTVLLEDGHRFTGQIRPGEVAQGLVNGDPAQMGTGAFARMINAGDASGLARMMLNRRQVFPGVMDLLASEMFSLRLGAMVALEEIGEADPALALEALAFIWERMEKAGLSAQGDMVYLIGELGNESWMSRLEDLLEKTTSKDLRDAIEEAIESLTQKNQE